MDSVVVSCAGNWLLVASARRRSLAVSDAAAAYGHYHDAAPSAAMHASDFAATRRCAARDLSARVGRGGVAGGHADVQIALTNHSAQPCALTHAFLVVKVALSPYEPCGYVTVSPVYAGTGPQPLS